MGDARVNQTSQGERSKGKFDTSYILFLGGAVRYLFWRCLLNLDKTICGRKGCEPGWRCDAVTRRHFVQMHMADSFWMW